MLALRWPCDLSKQVDVRARCCLRWYLPGFTALLLCFPLWKDCTWKTAPTLKLNLYSFQLGGGWDDHWCGDKRKSFWEEVYVRTLSGFLRAMHLVMTACLLCFMFLFMLTCILEGALSKSVKEMAVAAIAWVEGSPYSASTRGSSLTTGGEEGRGSFRMSFITWPTYITNCRGESQRCKALWCLFVASPNPVVGFMWYK